MGNPSKRDKSILKVIYTDFAHKKCMILLAIKALPLAVILIDTFEAIETYIQDKAAYEYIWLFSFLQKNVQRIVCTQRL